MTPVVPERGAYGLHVLALDYPRYLREGRGLGLDERVTRAVMAQRAWTDRCCAQLDALLAGRGFAPVDRSGTSMLEYRDAWTALDRGARLKYDRVAARGRRGYWVALTRTPEGLETWELGCGCYAGRVVARGCCRADLIAALDARKTTQKTKEIAK